MKNECERDYRKYKKYNKKLLKSIKLKRKRLYLSLKKELSNVIKIISSYKGVNKIILFGSLVNKDIWELSDIDIAVSGVKPEDFFSLYGKIYEISSHKVDLVDLDNLNNKALYMQIIKTGKILYERKK